MKVLHVIPSLSLKRGGPSETTLSLVRHLNMLHLQAEIATTTDHGPDQLDVPTGKLVTYEGAPVYFFPRYSPRWSKTLREYAYAPAFSSWLKQNLAHYDLIHIHALFSYLPTAAMTIARKNNHPYLITPHGLLGKWPLEQRKWLKKSYGLLWEYRNLNHTNALHYTSHSEDLEAAALRLAAPSEIVPHGLDLQELLPDAPALLRQRYGLPHDEKIILFLSRLHPKKGLDLLIPAVAKLPKTQLILAGEGDADFERWLKNALKKNGLSKRTVLTGFVSGELKNLLLQGADCFVLPSRHENFGVVVLESLAAGTTAMVSDQVALADEIQAHQVGRVTTLRAANLCQNLEAMLAETEPKPILRLRKFVAKNYSWPVVTKSMIELYQKILARHTSPTSIK